MFPKSRLKDETFSWNTATLQHQCAKAGRVKDLYLPLQMYLPVGPWPVSVAEPGPSHSRGSCVCTLCNPCHRDGSRAGSLGTQKKVHLVQR